MLFLLPPTVSSWEVGVVQCVFRVLSLYDTEVLCVGPTQWVSVLPEGWELRADLPSVHQLTAITTMVLFGNADIPLLLPQLIARLQEIGRYPTLHAIDFDQGTNHVLTDALNGSRQHWSVKHDTAPYVLSRCTAFAYSLLT